MSLLFSCYFLKVQYVNEFFKIFGILIVMFFKEVLVIFNEVIMVFVSVEDEEVLGKVVKNFNEV